MDPEETGWDELGVLITSGLVVARSDRAAVVVRSVLGYTSSLNLAVRLYVRAGDSNDRYHDVFRNDDPTALRLGFSYEEGPVELRVPLQGNWAESAGAPMWRIDGGYGGGGQPNAILDAAFLLEPYSGTGRLAVSVQWLAMGIERTTAVLALPTPEEIATQSSSIWS